MSHYTRQVLPILSYYWDIDVGICKFPVISDYDKRTVATPIGCFCACLTEPFDKLRSVRVRRLLASLDLEYDIMIHDPDVSDVVAARQWLTGSFDSVRVQELDDGGLSPGALRLVLVAHG